MFINVYTLFLDVELKPELSQFINFPVTLETEPVAFQNAPILALNRYCLFKLLNPHNMHAVEVVTPLLVLYVVPTHLTSLAYVLIFLFI